ncbi:MAG: glycosyltransferase family 2 protein [Burkholderiales bacterium]|nr:glycosyltransferase family 2 protein [Burkholderiales bacterium]
MPVVSVIVPCRNERAFVEAFCRSALAQELPAGWTMELVVADGQSDDGTAECLAVMAAAETRLRVIDNPGRIVSTGLNRALSLAQGEVIVRMDVHTVYEADYVQRCLEALAETGADNVGGPWRAVALPQRSVQAAVAAAFQSRWLAGGARSRQLDYSGWVDTVYLGCWPRASFERFGGFDEQLVRNQDDEHNLRIRRGGGRIWQAAAIRSSYHPRSSVGGVFRQYLQYGYWKPFVMRKHGQAASVRQLVPGAFVVLCLSGLPAWALGVPVTVAAAAPSAYALMVLGVSTAIAARQGWRLWPWLPGVIAAYHMAYGLGTLLGWLDVLGGARAGRSRFARLTR